MGKKANMWVKRIFSVSTLTTIATVVAACIAIIQYVENNSGKFVAFVNNEEAKSPITNTILVYLDKDSADLSQLGVFPKITNPSKYSLQDVLLTYRVDSKSSNISYSDFYSVHRVANGVQATNNDKTLYAKTDMPDPFYYFVIKDNGKATVDLRATYKGVDTPFTFHANLFARKLFIPDSEKRKNAIFENAYNFASSNNLKIINLYILDHESVESFKEMTLKKLSEGRNTVRNPVTATNEESVSEKQDNNKINPKIKTIKQIEKENEDVIKASKENHGNPWYMYIVGGILFLIMTICLLADVFLFGGFCESKLLDKFKYLIGFLLATFIGYLCFFYFQTLFDEKPIDKFWAGLALFCHIAFFLGLWIYCSMKTCEYFDLDDDNDWPAFIYFLLLLWPFYIIWKFIVNNIPF